MADPSVASLVERLAVIARYLKGADVAVITPPKGPRTDVQDTLREAASRLSSPEGTRGDTFRYWLIAEVADYRARAERAKDNVGVAGLSSFHAEYQAIRQKLVDVLAEYDRQTLSSPSSAPAATPAPELTELTWYRHNWGQLRKWLKEQIAIWDAPTLRTQKHLADMARARFRDVLHEMDQRSAGNRDAPVSAAERPAPTWQPIETCPKMRTVLLFAVTDVGPEGRVRNWKTATGSFHEGYDDERSRERGFTPWTWDGHQLKAYEVQPTHWMPLPAPPGPVGPQETK